MVSWIGSLNIGQEYIYHTPLTKVDGNPHGIPADPKQWHDGMFHIAGSQFARSLNRLFASQWQVLGGDIYNWKSEKYNPKTNKIAGTDMCALFICFPGNPRNIIQSYFCEIVKYSPRPILIENPYIIDKTFWNALKKLEAVQASKITVINPYTKNDHPINAASIRQHLLDPMTKGLKYYDYSKGKRFSHWKIMIVAGSNIIFHGSYNLNTRSAVHDFEANVLVKSEELYKEVDALLFADIAISAPIDPKKLDSKLDAKDIIDKIEVGATEYFS